MSEKNQANDPERLAKWLIAMSLSAPLPAFERQLLRASADALLSAIQADVVCEHGTAMDVHCCGCHSGFIFKSCQCVGFYKAEAQ